MSTPETDSNEHSLAIDPEDWWVYSEFSRGLEIRLKIALNERAEAIETILYWQRNSAQEEVERKKLEEKFARLPANWFEDSSLSTWFPYAAKELAEYEEEQKNAMDWQVIAVELQEKIGFLEMAFRTTGGNIDIADDEQEILGFYSEGCSGTKATFGRTLSELIENMMIEHRLENEGPESQDPICNGGVGG